MFILKKKQVRLNMALLHFKQRCLLLYQTRQSYPLCVRAFTNTRYDKLLNGMLIIISFNLGKRSLHSHCQWQVYLPAKNEEQHHRYIQVTSTKSDVKSQYTATFSSQYQYIFFISVLWPSGHHGISRCLRDTSPVILYRLITIIS